MGDQTGVFTMSSDVDGTHGGSAQSSPSLLQRRLWLIKTDSSFSLVSQGDDTSQADGGFYANGYRETQSDCEIIDLDKGGKLKKRRGSKFSTISNSLRRLGSIRKSKEPRHMSHLPALLSGLNNIAFGIGAGLHVHTEYNDNGEPGLRMRSKSNEFDMMSSMYRRRIQTDGLDSAGGDLALSVDILMDRTSYLDIKHEDRSSGGEEAIEDPITPIIVYGEQQKCPLPHVDVKLDQLSPPVANGRPTTLGVSPVHSESEGETLDRINKSMSTGTSIDLSTSEDSLDELDQLNNKELKSRQQRPVRRLHKSYKIAVKNRPVTTPSPMKEEPESVMTDEGSEDDLDLDAPSPFRRNMFKSYRVAVTKMKNHDGSCSSHQKQSKSFAGRTPWMASGKQFTRQAQYSYKAAMSKNKRSPPVQILTPEEFNNLPEDTVDVPVDHDYGDVPPTPKIIPATPTPTSNKKSASLPLKSSMNGDFVSITDLRRLNSAGSSLRTKPPEYVRDPNRPNSSPDLEIHPLLEMLSPPTRRHVNGQLDTVALLRLPSNEVLSESPNSSITGSHFSLNHSSLTDTSDTEDNTSELSNSSGGLTDRPEVSLEEREEMRDSISPILATRSEAKPRTLRQRKRGKDSRRILRDRRVDLLLTEQEEELKQLQRSRSLTNHTTNHHHKDITRLHSKSVKGVSLTYRVYTLVHRLYVVAAVVGYNMTLNIGALLL